MKKVSTLSNKPFHRMCVTIGELPTSYMESMTYYEMLAWFCDYLQSKVVPAINNNAELLDELKDYVEHYFDNLDVQEEINNKLDAMAEAGTLQEIITAYLNAKALFVYDTVADMVEADNLIVGSYARTLGYHAIDDGGSAIYKVTNQLIPAKEQIELANGLYANLCITSDTVHPEMFGAYGDDEHNDKVAIQKCFNSGVAHIEMNKKYYVSDGLIFKGSYRKLSGTAEIRSDSLNPILTINGEHMIIELAKITAPNPIKLSTLNDDFVWSQYVYINNVELYAEETCVDVERTNDKWFNEVTFNNVRFSGKIGVNIKGDYQHSGYHFINCANEVCSEVFFKSYNIYALSIDGCRNAEAWDKDFIRVENVVNGFTINNCSPINLERIHLNKSDTQGIFGTINGAIWNWGGSRIATTASCYNGVFDTPRVNYFVMDSSHTTYDFKTHGSNVIANAFIIRGSNMSLTVTVPEGFMVNSSFKILTQGNGNTMTLKYGTTTKTISLPSTNKYYTIRDYVGPVRIEDNVTAL